jgi:hypothetical protein
MTCTIWLIVEDETDGVVVKALLRSYPVNVQIRPPFGGTGGLSRLKEQLRELIATAKQNCQSDDCVTVLHDQDISDPGKAHDRQEIASICEAEQVICVMACDEIESWLLADNGLCKWLGINSRNWDEHPKPKEELKRQIKNRFPKMTYSGPDRAKVLQHVDGTGHQHSPSMKVALECLENSPCIQQETSP